MKKQKGFTLISKACKGFTLIEIIMVVFIFGIIIAVGGNLFYSILKGASKVEISKDAKQSGDFALSVMERAIRNARAITGNMDGQTCTTGMTKIKIVNNDESMTEFYCYYDSVNQVTKIASTSGTKTNYLTGNNISISPPTANCSSSTLIFDCDGTITPPKVSIRFTLNQKGTTAKAEDQASVTFRTTVFPRIYK